MAISAQTLFHFTKYKYLKNIIKAKAFFPRYCFEENISQNGYVFAYPMTCFCDIPLSQISSHAKTYSNNGIGLKKTWGINRGLNPVFYIQNDSYPMHLIAKSLNFAFKDYVKMPDGSISLKTNNPMFLKYFLDLTAYYKPRAGRIWNKVNKSFEVSPQSRRTIYTDFYNEREWRFVPDHTSFYTESRIPVNFIPSDLFYINEIFQETIFNDKNKDLEGYQLSFSAEDVKYIIVEKRPYVKFMSDFITGLDECIYTNDEKNILISRIISLTQIKEDF